MEKIAILTINDDNNYGNRLQNYASQEVLKKYNYNVQTIINFKNCAEYRYYIFRLKCIIKKLLIWNKNQTCRYNNFQKFNKNIKVSRYIIDENHIPNKIKDNYKCFFTGSDQVWNYTFERMSDVDFLTFANKEKRNSFSASFGINEIPENMKKYYKEKINGLNNISVREDRGKELIEELTGRKDAIVLIDPTMMLSDNEWDKLIKRPKMLDNKKYILNYFLGELSEKRNQEISRIAKENDCEIINILDGKSSFYGCGPSEFLYLEKNAFLICTDSFHSTIFAIIYNRPFVIFNREDKLKNMNSRLDTLLTKFKLEDRKCKNVIRDELLNCDYKEAYKILEQEKNKVTDFLDGILKNKN